VAAARAEPAAPRLDAARAIARRAFADGRVRTFSFAALFALMALVQVVGYEHSYPTVAERVQFAASFGGNKAIRLFYGVPHDLLTVGGYAAWRVGGIFSIFAAVWGVFAAVRALRAEEDSGRWEIVLAGAVRRRTAYRAATAGALGGAAVLWAASWLGLLAGGLAPGPSAYLALEIAAVAVVFLALGALVSQLAPSRRLALGIGMGVFAIALVLRIVADTAGSLEWLRWATPLGWAEELRPFTGARPAVLLLFGAASAALFLAAARIAVGRDVGTGLLASADSAPPRLRGLSSPTALALRGERGTLVGWFAGIGLYAIVVGLLVNTFNAENISRQIREQIAKLGGASIVTPKGAVGFYFLIFAFAISLFACAQVSAARHEESESRLETLFATPASRSGWLGGRMLLAAATALALALMAGVLAWAAALSQGAHIPFGGMLEAGLNCMPSALLFLALSALAFATVPRATAAVAYGLVSVAFCWYLFGALLGAPQWTLDLSPFQHVAPVPAQPFKVGAALIMLGVAALALLAAFWRFGRRDVLGE
jgi:ABC-2 type transport system permease protein